MCVHVCVWMCVCVNHVSHSKIFFFFLMKSAYDTLECRQLVCKQRATTVSRIFNKSNIKTAQIMIQAIQINTQ